jgi:uncharacterized peroxidase-related enzyme
MVVFRTHTAESAPEAARQILADTQRRLGFVPNLYGNLAESPEALQGYASLSALFTKTALTPGEQQVVLLVTSVENGCEFCVAAHSFLAKAAKVDAHAVGALRQGEAIADGKLNALARFTRSVVQRRGHLPDAEVNAFLAAGYQQRHILDVLLGVAMKTLSNYANHITGTQLNVQLESERWSAPRQEAAGRVG